MLPSSADVIVVGAGNAALCAALAAAEHGVSVLVLERAPENEAGGNSRFTAGAFRCVYNGVDDLRALMPDLTDDEVAKSDFGTYTEEEFFDDMGRVTEYRTHPELCEILIRRSKETMLWMRDKGVRFMPIWGRQAYKIDGKFKFWGGLTVEAWGGGPGLVDALTRVARTNGVAIAYGARALSLIADDDGVKGVRVKHNGKTTEVRAKGIVLAAGGFQANTEMRTRYLGPLWELAKVRGTRFNTATVSEWRSRLAQCRRATGRGGPRRRLGPQRAGIRRSIGRRQFSEAFLSARDHDQRQRRAFRR
jgi:tricarballylate dehydrogenase